MKIKRGTSPPFLVVAATATIILIATDFAGQCQHHVSAFTTTSTRAIQTRSIATTKSRGYRNLLTPFNVVRYDHGRESVSMSSSGSAVAEDEAAPEEGGGKEDRKEALFESLGKGIARDYKARLPYLKSDISDGINVQVRVSLCKKETSDFDIHDASLRCAILYGILCSCCFCVCVIENVSYVLHFDIS